jgi:hypothetical protein
MPLGTSRIHDPLAGPLRPQCIERHAHALARVHSQRRSEGLWSVATLSDLVTFSPHAVREEPRRLRPAVSFVTAARMM